MSRHIFVTGGVISGLGKGVSAASLGRLLKARGFSVFVQKLDPYLNLDPGTMSPLEHGEVYVTKDGGETDLDLGHYERFVGTSLTKDSNFTAGQIMSEVLRNERKGKYNGKTVQVIPHVTNQITKVISESAKKSNADFVITEVGGTIGDIESLPFIYAIAKYGNDNKEKCFFMHTTYVPYLEASNEFKSKPAQRSISELRQYGINPNMILLRANKTPTENVREKVSIMSQLNKENVISVPNADDIYKVPVFLEKKKLADKVLEHFGLKKRKVNLEDWTNFVKKINKKKNKTINVALVGKYVAFQDAYMSILQAIKISSTYANVKFNLEWISAEKITKRNVASSLKNANGVIILPGFGKRGFDGKVIVADYLRNTKIPTLGICYGLQAMTIAQAKYVGYKDAITTENDSKGTPIIDIINGKNKNDAIGGTLRIGEHKTIVKKNTLAHNIYKSNSILERHRHRYEVNPKYKDELEKDGFIFSGYSKETNLAEIVEYKKHPFYIGVQYHPEFTSNPLTDHPLFRAFVNKAKAYKIK